MKKAKTTAVTNYHFYPPIFFPFALFRFLVEKHACAIFFGHRPDFDPVRGREPARRGRRVRERGNARGDKRGDDHRVQPQTGGPYPGDGRGALGRVPGVALCGDWTRNPSRLAAWCPKDPAPCTTTKRVEAAPEPAAFSRWATPMAAAAAASPLVQRVSSLDLSVMAAPPSLTMTRRGRVTWERFGRDLETQVA